MLTNGPATARQAACQAASQANNGIVPQIDVVEPEAHAEVEQGRSSLNGTANDGTSQQTNAQEEKVIPPVKRRPLCPALEEARSKLALLEALYYELAGATPDGSDDEDSNAQPNGISKRKVSFGEGSADGNDGSNTDTDERVKSEGKEHARSNEDEGIRSRRTKKKSRVNEFDLEMEKMLRPILSTLGDVVTKEQNKREAVLSEMDDLGTQVMAATDMLGEEFSLHVNDTTGPPLASVYQRRDAMLAIRDRVNAVLEERRMTMEKLYESAGFVRQEIGDLQDEEFSLAMCKDYSAGTMAKAAHVVQELELEKRVRFDQLCDLVSSLYTLLTTLNIAPATEYDSIVISLFPDSSAINPPTIEAAKQALSSSSPHPSPPRSSQSSHIPYAHQSRYALPRPLTLTRHCAQVLRERKEGVLAEWERRKGLVRAVVKEIGMFWDELEVEDDERRELKEDVEMLDEYLALAEELRVRWREEMEAKVDGLLGQLGDLWEKCRVSDEDQGLFMSSLKTNLYSPVTVELLIQEIERLTARYEKYGAILEKIQQREDLLKKMLEFEKTASDPRRLFRSSFQLNEEERFRKTCFPTLMKMENALKVDVAQFEIDNGPGAVVEWKGERFLDLMEREISERFINETVFFIGAGHNQSQNRNGVTPSDDAGDADVKSAPSERPGLKRTPSVTSLRTMRGGGGGMAGDKAAPATPRPRSAVVSRNAEPGSLRKSASVQDMRRGGDTGAGGAATPPEKTKWRKSAEMASGNAVGTPKTNGRGGLAGARAVNGSASAASGSNDGGRSVKAESKGGVVGRLARKGSTLFGGGKNKGKDEDGKKEVAVKGRDRATSGSNSLGGKSSRAGR
ncbi:hypothetical protein HK097_011372 [Rhizophlyctis rosea]|uniref:Uncharacterized protein n=1 Tax=Rhizophlyctis rosea TaxID=64517 RepID=A0AAD5SJY1_9FUNG|nr:hypothetical protein HK097_011372 [Rhizophlyctis rosea]